MEKEIVVSGITATGKLTLGNYIGAIKNIVANQDQYQNYIFVADLHAITNYIDPQELLNNKKQIYALYLACGVDPNKSTIFFQSNVAAHTQLNWILTCQSTMGELSRMTQFKDKSQKAVKQANGTEMVPTGLFTYPTLMAADILLYNGQLVPVGIDQKQHLELAQSLIQRINKKYHLDFNIPKPLIAKLGQKINSLTNPLQKMSKSDPNLNSAIYLLDNPEVAYKKIQRAITDSENKIYWDDQKPGIKNLLTIYACLKNEAIENVCDYFKDKSYKDLKHEVGVVVKEFLINIQAKYQKYQSEIEHWSQIGAQKANEVAQKNLTRINNAFGLEDSKRN